MSEVLAHAAKRCTIVLSAIGKRSDFQAGGITYPIIFQRLQPVIGFGWTTRVIAFMMFATMTLPMASMRPKSASAARQKATVSMKGIRNAPYLVFILGVFFGFMSLYVTFFYIELYAQQETDVPHQLSTYLLPIMNASSTMGRLVPSFYADKIGPLNMQTLFAFGTASLCFGWIGIKGEAGLISFCILYGFLSGSFASLPGTTVVSLSRDVSTIGLQISFSFFITGSGILVGGPIAGAILDIHGGWAGLQGFCGALLAASGLCSMSARILKAGTHWNAKA